MSEALAGDRGLPTNRLECVRVFDGSDGSGFVIDGTNPAMGRLLHERQDVSELAVARLPSRKIRYEAALVDQVFNSTEKRLARMLLLLVHFYQEGGARPVAPWISQAGSARMVGTSRAKGSHFLNKFRAGGQPD